MSKRKYTFAPYMPKKKKKKVEYINSMMEEKNLIY